MYNPFRQYLHQFTSLTDAEWEIIRSTFTARSVPKNSRLCNEGEIAQELYFLLKGSTRLFYIKEEEKTSMYVFPENHFTASMESFLRCTPSRQTLETMEDCELLVINYDRLQKLYEEIPKFNVISRKIAEQWFVNAQQKVASFVLEFSEDTLQKQ